MFHHHRGILGDCPGSQQSVISTVLEAACSVLPVYADKIYPSQVSDGVEDYIVRSLQIAILMTKGIKA